MLQHHTSRLLCRLHLDHHRPFIPKRKNLLVHPIPLFIHKLQIISEKHLGENEARFRMCKTRDGDVSPTSLETRRRKERGCNVRLPNTIPRPKAKRLMARPLIIRIPLIPQPPLRHKSIRIPPVTLRMTHGMHGNIYRRSARDVVARHTVATRRHHTSKARSSRRIVPERFLEYSNEVIQFIDFVNGNLIRGGEARPDFRNEFPVRLWVAEEEVRRTRQSRGARFAACNKEGNSITIHFRAGESGAFFLLVLDYVCEEIGTCVFAALDLLQALADHVMGPFREFVACAHGAGVVGEEASHQVEVAECEVLASRDVEGDGLQAAEGDGDPEVFFGVAEAVEGFAECEVGYYIKGREVCRI